MRRVEVFVAATGNAFMADIAAWLAEAAALLGHPSSVVDDGRPPTESDAVNLVVAPHEFYLLGGLSDRQIDDACRVSIPVCTEQPGTPWFEMGAALCHRSPFAVDINRHGVDALRNAGVDAQYLRLGGVPSMDRRLTAGARPTDVLFLGGRTPHRAQRLAELAPLLSEREADIRLFSSSRPVHSGVDGLVFGGAKYDTLARSRILLNIHRADGGDGYFEWARMVEAMANGCAVVTEPSTGHEPLAEGVHFLAGDDIAALLTKLLDDPHTCDEVGRRAAEAVLADHPLTSSLAPILDRAEHCRPLGRPLLAPRRRSRMQRIQQLPLLPVFTPNRALRSSVHSAHQGELALQREIDRVRCRLRHGSADHVERVVSDAYEHAAPTVSVIVTLFNYAQVVEETLESIVASRDVDLELVVVDDHSGDDSADVVRRFIANHPRVPALLITSSANRGLPASRNLAIGACRADKVMVMDADNLLYPTCLSRLASALDRDPTASMAYATLEEFGTERGLRSAMGWHVEWLCEANYIDAQAMIRRSAWTRSGGYRISDPLLFGWEDWEFWLRLAANGEHGLHVPQILGRYRRQEESMITTSNLFGDLMLDHLRELHPGLPWPLPGRP